MHLKVCFEGVCGGTLKLVYMSLQKQPRESILHFPIKERLEALFLHSDAFVDVIHHELDRVKPDGDLMYDVYDSPAWHRMMGEASSGGRLSVRITRIGLLFCIDGIPAFTYKVRLCA